MMRTNKPNGTHSRRARGGKLASKCIMIYPPDPDVRTELALLAALEGESFSRWMYVTAVKYMHKARHKYRNWNKMVAAFKENEMVGRKGMIGVPAPIEIEQETA